MVPGDTGSFVFRHGKLGVLFLRKSARLGRSISILGPGDCGERDSWLEPSPRHRTWAAEHRRRRFQGRQCAKTWTLAKLQCPGRPLLALSRRRLKPEHRPGSWRQRCLNASLGAVSRPRRGAAGHLPWGGPCRFEIRQGSGEGRRLQAFPRHCQLSLPWYARCVGGAAAQRKGPLLAYCAAPL